MGRPESRASRRPDALEQRSGESPLPGTPPPPPQPSRLQAASPACEVRWLGRVPYAEALALQEDLVRRRAADAIPDQLLLLEHPHVVTLGRAARLENVLVDRARLRDLGIDLFETGRGGDVTYHGPGQLVAYPILNLAPDRCDLHRYVRDLERVVLAVLAEHGIEGHVVPGRTGVWVRRAGLPEAKVGAIGVRVARWITSHGIALTVGTDLRYFGYIVPCGLAGSAVTSMAELLGAAGRSAPEVREVGERFGRHLGEIFGRRLQVEPRGSALSPGVSGHSGADSQEAAGPAPSPREWCAAREAASHGTAPQRMRPEPPT